MDSGSRYATEDGQFEKCLTRLRQELNTASWHFETYVGLKEAKRDHLQEINQAAPFWALTIDAHVLLAIMILNRFLDTEEQHLSLRNLLATARQNLDIFSTERFADRLRRTGRFDEDLVEHRERVTQETIELQRQTVDDLPASDLRNWRNKLLAHISKDWVLQGRDSRAAVRINESHLRTIINTFDDILNYYHGAYNSSVWIKDIPLKNEIANVFALIQRGLAHRRGQHGLQ
jgi:hypothetical protein